MNGLKKKMPYLIKMSNCWLDGKAKMPWKQEKNIFNGNKNDWLNRWIHVFLLNIKLYNYILKILLME